MISFRQFFSEAAGHQLIAVGLYASGTGHRPYAVVNVGKGPLLFYQSSQGTSGKEIGMWFPIFGLGKGDWHIKGGIPNQIGDYQKGYSIPQIQSVMTWLNTTYPADALDLNGPEKNDDGKFMGKNLRELQARDPSHPSYPFVQNVGGRPLSKIAYGDIPSTVGPGRFPFDYNDGAEVTAHIQNILQIRGLAPDKGIPLTLTSGEGQMTVNLKTPIGKSALEPQFGEDAIFFSEPQFILDQEVMLNGQNRWTVAHSPNATHATLLNDRLLPTQPQPLKSGDVLAVGDPARGIVKLPMTVNVTARGSNWD